ncbi:MAG: porin [Hyphomicrobiaceae bacterium]
MGEILTQSICDADWTLVNNTHAEFWNLHLLKFRESKKTYPAFPNCTSKRPLITHAGNIEMSANFTLARNGLVSAAALAASFVLVGNAQAADLGGNCCADLEERIAELEATTARKGNRKVSLTISGWVAEQVMWWDDGTESNVYVTGLGTTLATHFKLTGQATIAPGWQAGYVIHVEVGTADPLTTLDQSHDDGGPGINAHQSYWFINSDRLGKVSVGKLSPASDNTAILVDGSGSLVPANWVLFDNQNFFLRINGVAQPSLNWGDLAHCQSWGTGGLGAAGDCGGFAGPQNVVRYDSPTFGGFSVSASWGEDDMWDVAARYAGEFNGIKVAVAAAYWSQNDVSNVLGGDTGQYWEIGAYVQHVPTGLFAYGAYGADLDAPFGFAGQNLGETWYFKAGLRRKWNALGHTVLYGEYGNRNDMTDYGTFNQSVVSGTELRQWGLGVVQEIDAAAMSMWLSYRNFQGEVDCSVACSGTGVPPALSHDFDDMHIVKFGALINF